MLNRYINTGSEVQEQDLFQDLVIQMIQMSGQDVLYIPRQIFEIDPVLQEPKATVFRRSFVIQAYNQSGFQYDGEQNIMSKFGFRVDQTTDMVISKKRFAELNTGRARPMEGDLIYVGDPYKPTGSMTNTMFEINQVWYENPDWQFGRHFTYKLVLSTFTMSRQKFNSGKMAIDQLNNISDEDGAESSSNADIINIKDDIISKAFNRDNPFGDF